MPLSIRAYLLLATLVMLAMPLQAIASPSTLRVPDGAPVSLRPKADVVGDRVKAGQAVPFVADRDLVVEGTTIVASGAPASGTVVFAKGSNPAHPQGALIVAVESVQAVDGSWIPLRAVAASRGAADAVLSASVYRQKQSGLRGRQLHIALLASEPFEVYVDRDRLFTTQPGPDGSSSARWLDAPAPPATAGALRVDGGTVVPVRPVVEISSAAARPGDRVDLLTTQDVAVNGRAAIPAGSRAVGTVIVAIPAARMGRTGELVLCVDAVQAADQSWIPVWTAGEHKVGKKHKGVKAAAAHFVPVAALLVKGQEAVLPTSAVLQMEVREDAYVRVQGSPR